MKLALHWKIIIGLILGMAYAMLSAQMGWTRFTLDWIAPWGDIFISLLKMLALPLVLFSIIQGVSGLEDVTRIGRIGAKTLGLYLFTTVVAVSLGLLIVNFIGPGKKLDKDQRVKNRAVYDQFLAQQGRTHVAGERVVDLDTVDVSWEDAKKAAAGSPAQIGEKLEEAKSVQERGPLAFVQELVPDNIFGAFSDNGRMLQIIFFALFFGLAVLFLPAKTKAPLVQIIQAHTAVFMLMVEWIMKAAPYFVFALMAGKLAQISGDSAGGVLQIFKGLGWYSITVLVGLLFIVLVFYPLLFRLFAARVNLKHFFKGIGPAQLLAFSTSSSAATLPVTLECVEKNLGVSKDITGFVLPVGATVNMDGTSLYQAVAVIFLAQFHMVDLSLAQQLTIILTATLASIGAAAVPSAGLIMLIIVLESVGLDPAWIAIIFPIDRILDMCRTVVNVTGDATVASIIAASEGELNKEVLVAENPA